MKKISELQLTFDFFAPEIKEPKKKAKRKKVDYESLYEEIKKHPMTFGEIRSFLNISYTATAQAIDLLSIRYPIWNPSRGLYKLLTEEDFND